MEISKQTLNKTMTEMRWVIQELNCILPRTNNTGAIASSIEECIERLRFTMFNLDKKAKNLTKRKGE